MTIYELIKELEQIPNKHTDVVIRYGCLIAGDKIIIDDEDDLK